MVGLQTRHQTSRLGLLPIIFAFSAAAFSGINSLPFPPAVALAQGLVMGQFLVVWFVHTVCLLAHESEVPPGPPFSLRAWISAYRMIFNSRNAPIHVEPIKKAGQGHTGSGIAPSSMPKPEPSTLLSKRASFAFRQTSRIMLCIGIYHFCNSFLPLVIYKSMELLGPPTATLAEQAVFLRRLSQVSAFEVALRAISVVEFVATSWALANFTHSILSLVAVCVLCLDSPEEWPPIYGDIRATYTIRSFWSRFWHRLVSATWVSLATPIVRHIFQVKSRGPTSRLLSTVLVFLFSGATHGLVAWQQGFVCGWWHETAFFTLNSVAILVEDVVKNVKTTAVPAWMKVAVGYCWTWGFMFWAVPKTQYPKIECSSS
ncbi:hypothetical protein B0T10DRAFT_565357 [Thelonectria olida]|uniref:Wax synthase domain-containing protein n=1 Tax=Thelonectria olida TaxID=1576542 RepID=A0A9P9ALM6_9HYPO|nr:hypothetical protein B0T10DRAFT_567999 [Thelonectria olida]KAH6881189.1 hypothetical protein B0T10DRAFT_565357 [Thelonectria olida]